MNKYNNRRVVIDKICFDSVREGERYRELKLLYIAGKIRNLKIHPSITLCESYTDMKGIKHRRAEYIADFSYERLTEPDAQGASWWVTEIEDVKGVKTPVYNLKKRIIADRYGDIWIREV